jgi:phosphoenolpyruvate synthase/pyruvate phosphate dikinase
MVEWKGEIQRENSGRKAELLDSVEHFSVPNFFAVTRDEIESLVDGKETRAEILNMELPSTFSEQLENAYKEIGMSSEVREANGKARNLVGGQRENQLVSVRISGAEPGTTDYRLNVGSSGLEKAFREVLASYYDRERDKHPAVIVQKMIEPEQSGAVVPSYLDNYTLLEAVEGLGVSLEKGISAPYVYLMQNGQLEDTRTPESQVKITKHPLNGGNKRKTVLTDSMPFRESEAKELVGKAEDEAKGIKFAYKRGTFYVVDAFPAENSNPFSDTETDLEGIRASTGEIEGRVGEEVAYTEETRSPGKYQQALISEKGGYTSTDAQKARNQGKPAVFFFRGELEEGDKIRIGEDSVTPEETSEVEEFQTEKPLSEPGITATEVVPFTRYVPETEPIKSYADFFRFEGDEAVVDARNLDRDVLEPAMEYLDAEERVLVTSDPGTVEMAIRNGFETLVVPGKRVEEFVSQVRRQERKFILEKLRDL